MYIPLEEMSAIIRRIYAFVQVRNGEYDISSTQGDLKERLGETRSMEYVRHRTPRRRKNISCFTAPASLGLRLLRGDKKVSGRRLNQSVSALNSELPQIEP